jgi:hypothetical protein
MKKIIFLVLLGAAFSSNAQSINDQQHAHVTPERPPTGLPVTPPRANSGTGEYGTGKNPQMPALGEKRTYDTLGAGSDGRSAVSK